jgi:hypothetical protein
MWRRIVGEATALPWIKLRFIQVKRTDGEVVRTGYMGNEIDRAHG